MTEHEHRIETFRLKDDGRMPNNPDLPLLVYRGALAEDGDLALAFERRFRENGWGGSWRDGIYRFHHYHSNAHEVLGMARGEAQVRFGGASGPLLTLRAGDVAILPAGTGHRNEGARPDLLVVGAYPLGQEDYDLLRGDPSERPAALERIRRVPLPARDPLFGASGPLLDHWRAT